MLPARRDAVLPLHPSGCRGPATSVGEFLILIGSFQVAPVITVIATFGLVLASVYSPHHAAAGLLRDAREESMLKGLDTRELTMMLTIAGLLVLLGLYPQPVLDTASSSLLSVLHWQQWLPGGTAMMLFSFAFLVHVALS